MLENEKERDEKMLEDRCIEENNGGKRGKNEKRKDTIKKDREEDSENKVQWNWP